MGMKYAAKAWCWRRFLRGSERLRRKLGVSFWAYLTDRLTAAGNVLPLVDLMHQRAA
jgi:hypothetical protein